MFTLQEIADVEDNYSALYAAISSHLDDESDLVANLANIAAFLYWGLPDVNWAGFYVLKEGQLVLGPFCGRPACTRIPLGRGVCGTAAAGGFTIVVPDVHRFEGHIACDSDTNSEIVLPIFRNNELFGVLDIDSPISHRFNEADEFWLARIAGRISEKLQLIP